MTRRTFAAALAAMSSQGAAPARRVLGAQLYGLRGLLRREPDATLKALVEMGFTEVEGHNRVTVVPLAPRLKQFGLRLRSCVVETPLLTNNWEPFPDLKQITLREAIDSLAGAGAEYFVMGYIPAGARGDGEDFFRRTADRMNAAAEMCKKSGLKFVFQNHAFEFAGRPGFRPIELYKERLDLKLVGLELDVFTLSLCGMDALKVLKDWKGHVPLMRLNDKAKGTPTQFEESVGRGAYTEAGTGVIDFPALLKAAPGAGVVGYSVGQDESEDPLASLRKSFEYLKTL